MIRESPNNFLIPSTKNLNFHFPGIVIFPKYDNFTVISTDKMELFVTTVHRYQSLTTIVTMCSHLDVAAVLDPPPHFQSLRKEFFKLKESNFSIVLCGWMFFWEFYKNLKILFTEKFQLAASKIPILWCLLLKQPLESVLRKRHFPKKDFQNKIEFSTIKRNFGCV